MAKHHNRRQRKKLRIGEFQEFGFDVSARFASSLGDKQIDRVLDAFIDECIEANGLAFGGWAHTRLTGYITRDAPSRSAVQADREVVLRWLNGRSELEDVSVGELTDAWCGHDGKRAPRFT